MIILRNTSTQKTAEKYLIRFYRAAKAINRRAKFAGKKIIEKSPTDAGLFLLFLLSPKLPL